MVQFCDDPKKISTKSSYPQKYSFFLKNTKNNEIQSFEPKTMTRAYVCLKISEYPPGHLINTTSFAPPPAGPAGCRPLYLLRTKVLCAASLVLLGVKAKFL